MQHNTNFHFTLVYQIHKFSNVRNITGLRRANCSQTTGELLALVVANWGLGMLALVG